MSDNALIALIVIIYCKLMYGINDGEKLKATKLCGAIILTRTFKNKANLRKNSKLKLWLVYKVSLFS